MTSQSITNELSTTGLNALKPRVLHTAYFVADIERSLEFYRDVLGMREQQRFELGVVEGEKLRHTRSLRIERTDLGVVVARPHRGVVEVALFPVRGLVAPTGALGRERGPPGRNLAREPESVRLARSTRRSRRSEGAC